MKFAMGIIVLISILMVGILFFKTSSSKKVEAMNYETIKTIGAVYDVRTPEEYAVGHIKEATNLPLGDIQKGSLPQIDKNAPIYIYCRSGSRSAVATSLLKNAGFSNVTDLGGMSSVTALGGEVVQ